tara:strand:+ start:523 stop:1206 length:684 start_codon:yes stop_codon:yes gene_type:complete
MTTLYFGMHPSWKPHLETFVEKGSLQIIKSKLIELVNLKKTIFPPAEKIFRALELTSFDNLKVVIIGQDPYHGPNQADGLAFSVSSNQKIPPSLLNIHKEISSDLDESFNYFGDLSFWAKQGVLLLNSSLTVEQGKPKSHSDIGWQKFTNTIIQATDKKNSIVFLLWGADAQRKKILLRNKNNLVLCAPHPSPLSAHRGFFGCQHFSKTNAFLQDNNQEIINWIPKS